MFRCYTCLSSCVKILLVPSTVSDRIPHTTQLDQQAHATYTPASSVSVWIRESTSLGPHYTRPLLSTVNCETRHSIKHILAQTQNSLCLWSGNTHCILRVGILDLLVPRLSGIEDFNSLKFTIYSQ